MTEVLLLLILVFAAFIAVLMFWSSKGVEKIQNAIDVIRKKSVDAEIVPLINSEGAVGFDFVNNEIIIAKKNATKPETLKFNEIIEVEFLEDGEVASKIEKNIKLGRAVVGGALFGPVGAMIGGLSGASKTITESFVGELSINMHTNHGVKRIVLWDSPPLKKSSDLCKTLRDHQVEISNKFLRIEKSIQT